MNEMLLIDPFCEKTWHCGLSLGLASIAGILESQGRRVKVVDCQIMPDYEREIIGLLKDYSLVGMSVSIGTITNSLRISTLIRKYSPKTKIVIGGPHATVIYDKLIPEYADVVVRGEGEHTVAELTDSKPLKEILGIAYWDNGLKVNPPRSLIEDLDYLPTAAYHLFDLTKYKMRGTRTPWAPLITSRGCPYQCIFCGNKIVHGNRIRTKSVEKVVDEIDYLVKRFNVKEIHLCDSVFNFDLERVKDICQKIIRRKYKRLIFHTSGMRADICDNEMLRLMKKAGFCHVRIGIESGSQEILDKINKNLDLSKVKNTVIAMKKAGLEVGGFFMLGLPFDNTETMQQTLAFSQKLPLDEVCFSVATPLPGTRFYEIVREQGTFLQDLNLQTNHMRKASYEIEGLRAEDVNTMLVKAFKQFYSSPRRLYRIIFVNKFILDLTSLKLLFSKKEIINRKDNNLAQDLKNG